MNQISSHIYDTFFSGRPAAPKRQPPRRAGVAPLA
jgi:hypothetical protein